MTGEDKDFKKMRGWTRTFQAQANAQQASMDAARILDMGMSKVGQTPEQLLLQQASYIIVGAFDAHGIPFTPKTLEVAVNIFVPDTSIPFYLKMQAVGEPKDDPAESVNLLPLAETAEPFLTDDSRMQRMMAFIQKNLSISDKVEAALLPSLHRELQLAPQTSAYDTVQATSLMGVTAFRQLLEAAEPGIMTNPKHRIWESDIPYEMTKIFQDMQKKEIIRIASKYGLFPGNPPAPS